MKECVDIKMNNEIVNIDNKIKELRAENKDLHKNIEEKAPLSAKTYMILVNLKLKEKDLYTVKRQVANVADIVSCLNFRKMTSIIDAATSTHLVPAVTARANTSVRTMKSQNSYLNTLCTLFRLMT